MSDNAIAATPADDVERCKCFGGTGFQASTHHDADDVERCDLCGLLPVAALSALRPAPQVASTVTAEMVGNMIGPMLRATDGIGCQAGADYLNAQIAALAPRAPDLWETWPDELTPALSDILGTMCFECIHLAQAFRAVGFKIPNKAEAEQAFVIHRMLLHWRKAGDEWRASAQAELTGLRAAKSALS